MPEIARDSAIARRVSRLGTHSAPPSVSRPPAAAVGSVAHGLKYHHNNALMYGPDAVVWGHVAQFLTARDIGMFSMTCRGKAAFVPYLSQQGRAYWRFVQWQHAAAAEAARASNTAGEAPKMPPYGKDMHSDGTSGSNPRAGGGRVGSDAAASSTVTSTDGAVDPALRPRHSNSGNADTTSNPASAISRRGGAAGRFDTSLARRDASEGFLASEADAMTDSASHSANVANQGMRAVDTAATMPAVHDTPASWAPAAGGAAHPGLGLSDQLPHEFSPARVLIPSPPCAVDSIDLSQSTWSTDEHNRPDRWSCCISMHLPLFRFCSAILAARVASYVRDSPCPEPSTAARNYVVGLLAAAAQIGPDKSLGSHVGDMVVKLALDQQLGIVPASLMCTVYGSLSTQSPFLHLPEATISDADAVADPGTLDDSAFVSRLQSPPVKGGSFTQVDMGLPAALLPDYRRDRFVTPLQAAMDLSWIQELRQKREQSLRAPWWCLRVLAELRRREDVMREHVFPRLSMFHAQREMVEDWDTRMQWRSRLIDWLRSLVVHWQLPMPLLVDAVSLLDMYTLHHGSTLNRTSMQLVAIVSFLHQLRCRGANEAVLKPIQEVARDYTPDDFAATERSLLGTVGNCMHTLYQVHNIPFGAVCTREVGVLDASVDLPTAGMAAPSTAPRHAEALLADAVRVARLQLQGGQQGGPKPAMAVTAAVEGVVGQLPSAVQGEVEAAAAVQHPAKGRGRGDASNFTPTTASTAPRRELPTEGESGRAPFRIDAPVSEHGVEARAERTDDCHMRSVQRSLDPTEDGEGGIGDGARLGGNNQALQVGTLRISAAVVAKLGPVQALPVRLSERSVGGGRWGSAAASGLYLMRPIANYGSSLLHTLLLGMTPLNMVQQTHVAMVRACGGGAVDSAALLSAFLASAASSLAKGGRGGSPLGTCAPWAGAAAAITQLSAVRSCIGAFSWGAEDGVGGVAFTLPLRSVGTAASSAGKGGAASGRQPPSGDPLTPRKPHSRRKSGGGASLLASNARPAPPEGSRPLAQGVRPRVASAVGGSGSTSGGAVSPAVHSKGAWHLGGGSGSGSGSSSPSRREGGGVKGGITAIPAGMTGFGSGIMPASPQRRPSAARGGGLKLPSVAEGGGAVTGGGALHTPSGAESSPFSMLKGVQSQGSPVLEAPLPAEADAAAVLPDSPDGGGVEGGSPGEQGSQLPAAASTVHALLGRGPNSMMSMGGLMHAFGSAMMTSPPGDEGATLRSASALSAKSPMDTAPPPQPVHAFTHGLHRRLASHFSVPMSALLPTVVYVTPLHPLHPPAQDKALRRKLQAASFAQPAPFDVVSSPESVPLACSGMSSGISLQQAVLATLSPSDHHTAEAQDLATGKGTVLDLSAPLHLIEGEETPPSQRVVGLPPSSPTNPSSESDHAAAEGWAGMQRQSSEGANSSVSPSMGAPALGMGGGPGGSLPASALLATGDNLAMSGSEATSEHALHTGLATNMAALSLPMASGEAPRPPFFELEGPLLPGAMLAGPMMMNPDLDAGAPSPAQQGSVRSDVQARTGPLVSADLQLLVACSTYKLVDLLLQLLDGAWIVPAVPAIHECVFLCMRHWELETFSPLTRAFACIHMGILCTPRVRRRSGVFNWYRVAYAMLHTDRAAVDEVLYLLYRRADANGLLSGELHVVLQALPHLQARIEQEQGEQGEKGEKGGS